MKTTTPFKITVCMSAMLITGQVLAVTDEERAAFTSNGQTLSASQLQNIETQLASIAEHYNLQPEQLNELISDIQAGNDLSKYSIEQEKLTKLKQNLPTCCMKLFQKEPDPCVYGKCVLAS